MKGFPEAIEAVFPKTQVQLCLVHLVRHSLSYLSYKACKEAAADLKLIYRATTLPASGNADVGNDRKMGNALSSGGSFVAGKLDAHRPAVSIYAGNQVSDLHGKCDRIIEFQSSKNHQKSRSVSKR